MGPIMKAVIMVGASGSGKSTVTVTTNHTICSADLLTWDADGFHPDRLGKAHAQCLRAFIEALNSGQSAICDNTNCSIEEISPYIAVSRAYGVEPLILILDPGLDVCLARNAERPKCRQVPNFAVERQYKNMKKLLRDWPPFWPKITTEF